MASPLQARVGCGGSRTPHLKTLLAFILKDPVAMLLPNLLPPIFDLVSIMLGNIAVKNLLRGQLRFPAFQKFIPCKSCDGGLLLACISEKVCENNQSHITDPYLGPIIQNVTINFRLIA